MKIVVSRLRVVVAPNSGHDAQSVTFCHGFPGRPFVLKPWQLAACSFALTAAKTWSERDTGDVCRCDRIGVRSRTSACGRLDRGAQVLIRGESLGREQ